MVERRIRACPVRLVALVLALLLVSTGFAASASAATSAAANPLGTKNPAKGTPVKVGFVTDGKYAQSDETIETPVANATAKWINQYQNGIGGHPIVLDRCEDLGDPSKGTDCANQMIQDNVAAVVIGSNAVLQNVWAPLHQAGIPTYIYGGSGAAIAADTQSTFILFNSTATLVGLPAGAAKKAHKKKVTAIVIDVPVATDFFKGSAPANYKKQGLDFKLVPVPAGTADMTPQMQQVVSDNPDGVVYVLGNDSFCIAAFNGLRAAGFKGIVTTVPNCISDATRQAVPASFLKGMKLSAGNPLSDAKDPTIKQYYAVLDKFGGGSADKSKTAGAAMFTTLAGFAVANKALTGKATPATLIATTKAMPWSVLPGTGGLHFRCNGKADPTQPAACSKSTLAATTNGHGDATVYTRIGDTPIPG